MDELERKVLQAIDDAVAASPPTMPFVLSQEYLRLIRRAEEHPANRPGADKTWGGAGARRMGAPREIGPEAPAWMSSFAPLARALVERGVRYLLIEVAGANLHAHSAGVVFSTQDRDVFLPRDPANLLLAWQACEACGLSLWSSGEPLDRPRDLLLAVRVVQHADLTTATDDGDLRVDLTFVMAGFTFDDAWRKRKTFQVAGIEVPAARWMHIATSKAAAGRLKDRLFLATHKDALQQLFGVDEREG